MDLSFAMFNQYSTQELSQHLPEVIKQIQQGNPIEITPPLWFLVISTAISS